MPLRECLAAVRVGEEGVNERLLQLDLNVNNNNDRTSG